MSKIKCLHIGLCVQPEPYNGFQKPLMEVFDLREIYSGDPEINQKIINISNEFKPELVFIQVQTPDIISHSALHHLKTNGAFIINWTGDKRSAVPQWMIDCSPYIDITAFSNMEDVNECIDLGIGSHFLEIGYDPLLYTPIGDKVVAPEIVFFGNNPDQFPLSYYRKAMIEFLKAHYGDRFGFYGSGWIGANGSFNGDQKGEAAILRSAKIAINLSHFNSYTSDRMYRSLGSGVCVLSRVFTGIDKFEDRKDLMYWNELADLKEKIDYYLVNDAERDVIAARGNALALSKYTFTHMVRNIEKLYLDNK